MAKNKHFDNRNVKICTAANKRCYPESQARMIVALNTISSNKEPNRNECRYYHCDKCNKWHLTSRQTYIERPIHVKTRY